MKQFSQFSPKAAYQKVGIDAALLWTLDVPERAPSPIFQEMMRRLTLSFDLRSSESAKELLIDACCAEVLPDHEKIKAWKAVPLAGDDMAGSADYLIAPNRRYLDKPLLCIVEAKKDDFDQGEAQCIVEMFACAWNNRQDGGTSVDIYGIVSNGQGWQFYKYTTAGKVYESPLFTLADAPRLLGVLDYVFGECVKNIG